MEVLCPFLCHAKSPRGGLTQLSFIDQCEPQVDACKQDPSCSDAITNLGEAISNPSVCPNVETCIEMFKPTAPASLELYSTAASCLALDVDCLPAPSSSYGSSEPVSAFGPSSSTSSMTTSEFWSSSSDAVEPSTASSMSTYEPSSWASSMPWSSSTYSMSTDLSMSTYGGGICGGTLPLSLSC